MNIIKLTRERVTELAAVFCKKKKKEKENSVSSQHDQHFHQAFLNNSVLQASTRWVRPVLIYQQDQRLSLTAVSHSSNQLLCGTNSLDPRRSIVAFRRYRPSTPSDSEHPFPWDTVRSVYYHQRSRFLFAEMPGFLAPIHSSIPPENCCRNLTPICTLSRSTATRTSRARRPFPPHPSSISPIHARTLRLTANLMMTPQSIIRFILRGRQTTRCRTCLERGGFWGTCTRGQARRSSEMWGGWRTGRA